MMKKKKKIIYLFFLLIVLLLILIVAIFLKLNNDKTDNKLEDGNFEKITLDFEDRVGNVNSFDSGDFISVGWLQVQGTTIDVPILKITLDGRVFENVYPTDFLNSEFVELFETATDKSIVIKKRVNQLYITTTSTVELENSSEGYELAQTGAIWGSGKYQVRLQYGYQSKSYLTQGFVIDNTALTGLAIKPVDLEATNKVISLGTFSNNTQNLIKDPFTFVYNQRPSGASIETTYTVIPFNSNVVVKPNI